MGKQWKQCQTLFILGGFKITADGDCSHEIKRRLLLGRKIMTNLDRVLKSRDITLPTKVQLPYAQAGFRKGRGTRGQIANIHWITEKAREFQKNIYICFIDYAKTFDCVDHNKLENSSRDGNTRPPDLPSEKSVCRSRSNS